MSTIKTFGLLLLTIIIQEIINWSVKDQFIVGIVPTLIFGTIWNLNNGRLIYAKIKDKRSFNLNRFGWLSFLTIAWVVVYMVLLNVILWPPDRHKEATLVFMPISALTAIFPMYALCFNIDFVTRGLINYYNDKGLRFGAIFSLLFFPVGIFWIQPKIQAMR